MAKQRDLATERPPPERSAEHGTPPSLDSKKVGQNNTKDPLPVQLFRPAPISKSVNMVGSSVPSSDNSRLAIQDTVTASSAR